MKKLKINYNIDDSIFLYIWIMQKNKVDKEAIKIVTNYCKVNKGKDILNDARDILCTQGYIEEVKQTDKEFILAYEDIKEKPRYLINPNNNKMFKDSIIEGGIDYYNKNKACTINKRLNKYKVIFKSFTVTVLFNDIFNILQMDCSCSSKTNCKHEYAAIIAINNKYFDPIDTNVTKVKDKKSNIIGKSNIIEKNNKLEKHNVIQENIGASEQRMYLTELLKEAEVSAEAKEYIDKIKNEGPMDLSKYPIINAECLILDICGELIKQEKGFNINDIAAVNNLVLTIIDNNINKQIEDFEYSNIENKKEDLNSFIRYYLFKIYEYIDGENYFKENITITIKKSKIKSPKKIINGIISLFRKCKK